MLFIRHMVRNFMEFSVLEYYYFKYRISNVFLILCIGAQKN